MTTKKTLLLVGLAAILVSAIALSFGQIRKAIDSPEAEAERLSRVLESTHSVEFFFLTRTGDYSLSPLEFKKASTIRVYRACGNNCSRFMAAVIDHLRRAKSSKCRPGQQDVLIEFKPRTQIVYSYSGRQIFYGEKCYLNEESVNSILRDPKFIF